MEEWGILILLQQQLKQLIRVGLILTRDPGFLGNARSLLTSISTKPDDDADDDDDDDDTL